MKERFMQLDGMTVELSGQNGDVCEIDMLEYTVPTTFAVSVEDGGHSEIILSISANDNDVFSERFTVGEDSLIVVSECLNQRGYNDIDAAVVEAVNTGICFKRIVSEACEGEYNGEYDDTSYFDFKGAFIDSIILEQDGNSLWKSRKEIELWYLVDGSFVTFISDFYQEDRFRYYLRNIKREIVQDETYFPHDERMQLLQNKKREIGTSSAYQVSK